MPPPQLRSQLKRLGKTVAEWRKALKLSQEDFAEKCDMHRTYMGHIERGEANVSFQNLAKLARALDVKLSVLLNRAGL
jgi:transcriptional regulator with XRE-family HTH domain